jgi:hypothetical protein
VCTVSWLRTSDGYHLLCSRDERLTRKPASAPFVQQRHSVRFISPTDGDHGGSWIAVNEVGLTFCLLNRYACERCRGETGTDYQSRGLLLMELVDCISLAEVRTRISWFDLDQFQPFTIVVLSPVQPALLCHWNGRDIRLESDGDEGMPLTSSSLDQKGVEACRKRLFERVLAERGHLDIQLLFDFHSSHLPVCGAYSPCMHREDASTVSFSWVTVAKDSIRFCYLPGAPCSYESLSLRGNLDLGHFRKVVLGRCTRDARASSPSVTVPLVIGATDKGGH